MSLSVISARFAYELTTARLRLAKDTPLRARLGRVAQAQRAALHEALQVYPSAPYAHCDCHGSTCPDCRPARRPVRCDCGDSCCRVCEDQC